MTFKPTQEQLKIVELAKTGQPFKIEAFAGAAKTTSLVMVSKELEHNSLYLAYNRRMAVEAREKFPDWVEVRTTHSLAFQAQGVLINHKLSRPVGGYRNVAGTASEIARFFRVRPLKLLNGEAISAVALGKVIRDSVNAFEYSADRQPEKKHIVVGSVKKYIMSRLITREHVENHVLMFVRELWKLRSDPNSEVLATHETYLKMYQLSSPDLSMYKTIYLDEAQDSNACILNIIMRQTTQVILVGDSFQAIYQWRGSSNALESVPMESVTLSTSFRFGQEVADVANLILGASSEADITGKKPCTMVTDDQSNVPLPYTKIFRTNVELLAEAIYLIGQGKSVHVEVDFRDIIKALESGLALYEGRMKDVKHDMYVSCTSWDDAELEGRYDNEMKRMNKMIATGEHVHVLAALRSYKHPANPEILLITAHKSKGLEWENVVIANDFPEAFEKGEYVWTEAERNLSYVAHTRAQSMLCVGGSVLELSNSGRIKPEIVQKVDGHIEATRVACGDHAYHNEEFELEG